MTDFKPEIANTNLPRGFRPVRLNLNKNNPPNLSENIYDEPCTNFESTNQHQVPPPPLPSSQPPAISSTTFNNQPINEPSNAPNAQPFWSLPSQEQEQLQHHLQQHLSRSPTPTFGPSLINADNIQKVITDKEPPANAEFLYETDAYKFYTIPADGDRKVMTIRQQNTINRSEVQRLGRPVNDAPLRTVNYGFWISVFCLFVCN